MFCLRPGPCWEPGHRNNICDLSQYLIDPDDSRINVDNDGV